LSNILIVDDEIFVRKVLIDWLKIFLTGEHNFLQAENGAEALRIKKKEDIDLIITDLDEPVNGYELVEKINNSIPIIIITGGCLKREVNCPCPVFKKPIDFASLIKKIEQILRPA